MVSVVLFIGAGWVFLDFASSQGTDHLPYVMAGVLLVLPILVIGYGMAKPDPSRTLSHLYAALLAALPLTMLCTGLYGALAFCRPTTASHYVESVVPWAAAILAAALGCIFGSAARCMAVLGRTAT
jgi:hypothetical protein